jgi:hypothetical protein
LLTISQLAFRLGFSRQQVHARMTAAEVVPLKRGGRSFLDEALVGCLDQQHQFLLNGYSLSEAGEFAVEMTGDTRRLTSHLFINLMQDRHLSPVLRMAFSF